MRNMVKLAVVSITMASGTAYAQATSPEQIICAMSGSCGDVGAPGGAKQAMANEKSFSLVRTGSMAPAAAPEKSFSLVHSGATVQAKAASATVATRPMVRPVAYTAKPAPASHVQQGSGHIEMMLSFPLGSAELTDSAKTEAQAFAKAMQSPQLNDMHFEIEGHTDAIGARDYNVDLSQRRAQSVVDYLVSIGIPANRMTAHGYGFDKPRAGLGPKAPGNRRVEFVRAS